MRSDPLIHYSLVLIKIKEERPGLCELNVGGADTIRDGEGVRKGLGIGGEKNR